MQPAQASTGNSLLRDKPDVFLYKTICGLSLVFTSVCAGHLLSAHSMMQHVPSRQPEKASRYLELWSGWILTALSGCVCMLSLHAVQLQTQLDRL